MCYNKIKSVSNETTKEKTVIIKNLFLFNGLSDNDKENIISSLSEIKSFKKGEIIYAAESFSNALGILIKGSAFAVTNNGNKVLMNRFEQGKCFGAAAVFGADNTYSSTVTADTDCTVLFIPEKQLKDIFAKYPVTALNYIKFLSGKIRFLNSKLSMLSCSSAEDTVLTYFSSVADSFGIAKIPKNMTQLSKMLGLGRATLYRCLDSLQEQGYILKENNYVKVIKNEKNS